ncbi:hypothetical protein [Leifsonia soli]|uniref:Uncharacterized protein n=2 Tax=Leifsonia TaxID=110932 RepID=A0A852T196_9MICO|nr:hypothetical protein [Leifsonia soli]
MRRESAMGDGTNARTIVRDGPWGFFFLLAYIGAAIYFISVSDGSFWGVVLGLLQAIVWPVYVVYHVLVLLGA